MLVKANNAAESNQYFEMKVQTATPEALIGMLYEGAIRFLKQAASEMNDMDWHKAHTHIVRAQNVVSELNVSLDKRKGGELADNLSKIYDYVNNRLIEANIKKDPNYVNECIRLLSELNSAWCEVMKGAKSSSKAGMSLAG
ncbi:MAG: flagellar export chaperone FliS [Actinomycetota bacterium]|nr:flagellar export chaperone FliS [Actinomycetota bacterium]